MVVSILVLSGLGAVAVSESDHEYETSIMSFSSPIIKDKGQYLDINMDETNSYLIIQDKPMLPCYIKTFTYPRGTKIKTVTCEPSNLQKQTMSKQIKSSPAKYPVGLNVKKQVIKKLDDNPATNSYPGKWFEYEVGTGLVDNAIHTIVKVVIFPLQYTAPIKEVEWAENFEITIEYQTSEKQVATLGDQYSLVIITPDEFSDELDDLVTHKIARGVSTKLVSLNDVYSGVYFPVQGRDNQEKIKYFIKDTLENWATSYVLLIGSSMKFPARVTHINVDGDTELFITDLYYADIYDDGGFSSWDTNDNDVFGEYKWNGNTDDVDLYPDVYLGRLACRDSSDATTVVDKIITYEDNEAYTQDWFTDIVVAGADSFTNDYGDESGVDEGEMVNQEIIDIMDGFIPNKIWGSNGRLGKALPPYGRGELNNAINSGCGFVDLSGHGNPQVWASHPHNSSKSMWIPTPTGNYHKSNIQGLSNGDELPIAVLGGCSLSKYNSDSSCFGWSWLLNSNGGGIGSFGPTALGYAYIGDDVTQGLIEGMAIETFKAYKEDGALTFGEMWSKAITNYIDGHYMRDADYKTVEEWQPFGDPSLAIGEESQAPLKPNPPDGPTNGAINTKYTYSGVTTDPEGDKIWYMFDWDDGSYSGWVGPHNSGETGEASHKWTVEGTYEIRVKAKDEHGVQSEWSEPLPISMPANNQQIIQQSNPLLNKIIANNFHFQILSKLLGI